MSERLLLADRIMEADRSLRDQASEESGRFSGGDNLPLAAFGDDVAGVDDEGNPPGQFGVIDPLMCRADDGRIVLPEPSWIPLDGMPADPVPACTVFSDPGTKGS